MQETITEAFAALGYYVSVCEHMPSDIDCTEYWNGQHEAIQAKFVLQVYNVTCSNSDSDYLAAIVRMNYVDVLLLSECGGGTPSMAYIIASEQVDNHCKRASR